MCWASVLLDAWIRNALSPYPIAESDLAMTPNVVGKSSHYALSVADGSGKPFDGAKTYRLNIPRQVGTAALWSVVLYDPSTRAELQTCHVNPTKTGQRESLIVNVDGSVDLYFGPKAPAGKEANWTATIPNKSWYALFCLEGPVEPWFDKTWWPSKFEVLE